MSTGKQKRIQRRLDRRQKKVDESRATFGTNDPDLGKFDRRLNRLKRTVNKAEKQGMNVDYDTRNASGEGAVKTTIVKPKKGSATEGSKYGAPTQMGHSPAEMSPYKMGHSPMENQNKGYAKQERKDLMQDMPIVKDAMGGRSWISKHSKSAMMMKGPMEMGHSPAEMGHSPLEGHCMGKRK
tara:strand:+ start:1337 stop:1882 length:546 start_codon:yes stop_codon:yes gene_type:complete